MQKIKITTLVTILIALTCGATYAAIPIARGGYVDAIVGFSKVEDVSGADDVNGLGLNINLGYKLLPYFAIETGYTTYGASDNSFTGAFAWDAVLKAIIPFQEAGVEVFAKFGPAYIYNQNSPDSDCKYTTNIYYAIGGSYAYKSNMLLNVAWSKAIGNSSTGDFELIGIGVTYLL